MLDRFPPASGVLVAGSVLSALASRRGCRRRRGGAALCSRAGGRGRSPSRRRAGGPLCCRRRHQLRPGR